MDVMQTTGTTWVHGELVWESAWAQATVLVLLVGAAPQHRLSTLHVGRRVHELSEVDGDDVLRATAAGFELRFSVAEGFHSPALRAAISRCVVHGALDLSRGFLSPGPTFDVALSSWRCSVGTRLALAKVSGGLRVVT